MEDEQQHCDLLIAIFPMVCVVPSELLRNFFDCGIISETPEQFIAIPKNQNQQADPKHRLDECDRTDRFGKNTRDQFEIAPNCRSWIDIYEGDV